MVDRKTVIAALEHCATVKICDKCPMGDECTGTTNAAMAAAVELLKGQEPRKKGYWKYPQSLDCCCSECGNQPDHETGESIPLYDYCPYCGAEMEVKWDD